jgi:hypothetical protein
MAHKVAIGHHIPGRLRISVLHAKNNRKVLEGIAKSVGSMAGVRKVDISPQTGSIIVHYPKAQYDQFPAALADLGDDSEMFSLTECVEQEAEIWASRSELVRSVVEAVNSLNENVKSTTGNQVDLKVLLGLAGSVWAFLRRAEGTPLWVTLLIFALHSHVELQREALVRDLRHDLKARRSAEPAAT